MSRPICNRCGQVAKRKGRMSAMITKSNGKQERKYLCALCILDLRFGTRYMA
jgi:hypothetical protein